MPRHAIHPTAGISPLARIYRHAGLLLSGKAVGGAMSLGYLALALRALEPAAFGVLVMIEGYAMVMAGILQSEAWKLLVHDGAKFLHQGAQRKLQRLVVFVTVIDLAVGTAAILLAMAAIPFVGVWLDWPPAATQAATLYCLAVPFLMVTMPSGMLRLTGCFRRLGWQLTVMPSIRLLGAALLYWQQADLGAFLALWLISDIAAGVVLWALGLHALHRQGHLKHLKLSLRGVVTTEPGWWTYLLQAKAASVLDIVRDRLPMLLVGGALKAEAAGFYRLAAGLTKVFSMPGELLTQSVFPDLAELAGRGERAALWSVAWKSGLIAGLAALPLFIAILLAGGPIIQTIAGSGYGAAATILALLAAARLFDLFGFAFEPGLLAIGRVGALALSKIAMAATELGGIWPLMAVLGLNGAGIALIISSLVLYGLMAGALWKFSARRFP